MQTPQSIHGLNTFVALERRGVRTWIEGLERDTRPDLAIRLRNHVARQSFELVRCAHATFGDTLSQGLGTGRLPAHAGHLVGHVPNPGMNPGLDSVHAVLRGGLFSPVIAVTCLPWLPYVGLSVATAALGLCAGGAMTAIVLHRARMQGHEAPWLEGAAGTITAVGRASLTAYAAAAGALWGVVTYFAMSTPQASRSSRR